MSTQKYRCGNIKCHSMKSLISYLTIFLNLLGLCLADPSTNKGQFQDLGVPIIKAMLMGVAIGPDATGQKELLYFNFAQTGATLFLVTVNPDSGETHQYKAPVGPGAWALIRGPDEKMYLGTWESGYILKFDPQQPGKGLQVIGKPSATETYIWQFAIGKDGKLYGGTYGQAKLVSYDPKSQQMEDLGRMDDTQMYTRSIACGSNGKIYTAVGFGKANIVVYDPPTKTHHSILPDTYKKETAASVHQGTDGNVYAHCGNQAFKIEDESMIPIPPNQVISPKGLVLKDGRIITVGEITPDTGSFTLTDPQTGTQQTRSFKYQGDGSLVFSVGLGPKQMVYGSSAMPLEMFVHNPQTKKNLHLGNPTSVNGEIYSFLSWQNQLYVCAYPGSYLSVYDPQKPFQFGTKPESNPRGFGNLGDGHLRPRSMILGPKEHIYIGSLPPYGELGGAMAVFDPKTFKVVDNYRHLIKNQSIVSLAYEPKSGLVWGGSGIMGGGGTTPSEKEALIFAFDPEKKQKIFETALESGLESYPAICSAEGLVFIATRKKILVFDPIIFKVTDTINLPGTVLEVSLGTHSDGFIYGLTSQAVFGIEPKTRKVMFVDPSPVPIRCGFALTDQAVYLGSGAHLWCYVLKTPNTTMQGWK